MAERKTRAPKQVKRTSRTAHSERPEVLTLEEAAAYLRVPEQEVVQSVETDCLPGRQVGGKWRFSRTALQTWLSAPLAGQGFLDQFGMGKDGSVQGRDAARNLQATGTADDR